MMSKLKSGLAALGMVSLIAWAGPTLAQDTGFYAGIALGQSKINIDCEGATTCDEKDTAWKIFGGYQLNRNFAVELGYVNFGEGRVAGAAPPFGTASVTFESTAFELVAVGMLPLADKFSLYGKIGLYRADTDADVTLTGFPPATESDSNTDLTFGVGVRFDITRNLGLRAEWQRYGDVSASDFGESDIDVISLGVLFRF